jgi:hypothetical protein
MSITASYHWFRIYGLGIGWELASIADETGAPFMHESFDGSMDEYVPVLSRRLGVNMKLFLGVLLINVRATLWRQRL